MISYHSRKKGNQVLNSLHRQQAEWKLTPLWEQHKEMLVCSCSGCASNLEKAVEDRDIVARHWDVFKSGC